MEYGNSGTLYPKMETMTKRCVAIIPARGGSKGIPKKNIVPLGDKPLIAWTIEAALNASSVDEVYVSSDSDEILEISRHFGSRILKRPSELAGDRVMTVPVIDHVLEHLGSDYGFSYIALLQPTSPFRSAQDIDNAMAKMQATDADALISVRIPEESPLKAFQVNSNGYLSGIVNDKYPFCPRQELPITYLANGAIYLIKSDIFQEYHVLMPPKTICYKMRNEMGVDIDTLDDLKRAQDYIHEKN